MGDYNICTIGSMTARTCVLIDSSFLSLVVEEVALVAFSLLLPFFSQNDMIGHY